MVSLEIGVGGYEWAVLIKMSVAMLFGALIGWTRRTKAAGIRTFTLICLGSMLFTVLALDRSLSGTDPSRIISQIITGIGFIGAGVIWKHEGSLTGITTAATIWATAAIGIAIGLELWFLAGIGSVLAIIVLLAKKYVTHTFETVHEEEDTLVLHRRKEEAQKKRR